MIEDKITWLGHASFLIDVEKVIYIDPWKVKSRSKKADMILISHAHYDHYSVDDIKKIAAKDTTIIGPADCVWDGVGTHFVMKPGDTKTIDGVTITAIPAYNTNKAFHQKQNGWLGFMIETAEGSVYYAGDTDCIDEMKGLAPDVALLPVGGTYTMNAEDAVRAAKLINAAVIIPYHYGDIVGSLADAERLREKCETTTIIKKAHK
ncbi:MAG: MBL fold metallo-hydrolase [Candidatus Omnitrophica bacterium]|nr:MBL fold metallo-hydrolase [Candidatus Omnitrophota bacterium]